MTSMVRRLLWILPLLLCAHLARAEGAPFDDAPLRAVLQRFFEAFPRKDVAAALRACTEVERQQASVKAYLEARFADAADLQYRFERFRVRENDPEVALARATVIWTGKDVPTGMPDEGRETWDIRFFRELGEWKIWAFRPAERTLYARYLAAADHPARRAILAEDPEIMGEWLPYLLRVEADAATDHGKFPDAERLSDLALEASNDLGSENSRANAHLVRGYLREKRREWDPALREYDEALQCFDRLKDPDGQARAWRNAGRVYVSQGVFRKAVEAREKAARLFREAKRDTEEANALQDLGTSYQSSGRPDQALAVYERSLAINRRLGNRKGEAELIGNIASVRITLGQYAEALTGIDAARRIHREIGNRGSDSLLLTNSGNIFFALGRTDEAKDAYLAAVRVSRELGNQRDLMIALYNLAAFYNQLNDPDAAMEPASESAELAARRKDDSLLVNTQLLLGSVLLAIGKTNDAARAFETAAEEARYAGQESEEGTALLSLGYVEQTRHRFPEALRYASQAREIAKRAGNTYDVLRTWLNEGVIYREQRNWSAAAAAFEQATHLVEQTREQARVRTLQTSYFRQYAVLYGELAECYLYLGQPERAFAAAEELKGRSLVDVIQAGNTRINRAMSPEEKQQETALEGKLAGISAAAEKAVVTDERLRLTGERDKVRKELEGFQEALYLRHPDLRTRRAAFTPASPQQLRHGLLATSPGAVLLSYVVRPTQTLLFVVRKSRSGQAAMVCHRIPISQQKLGDRVEELWRGCSSADGAYQPAARALFRTLISPAAPELAGHDHLVIIPDTVLGTVPFGALLDGADRPLAAHYALSYAPSATALLRIRELHRAPTATPGSLLALGAPIFPRGFPDLPESRAEVSAVGRLFGKSARVLTGERATETEARRRLSSARYVHFATHGVLDPQAPMDSAVVLTRDATADGFLRARELVDLEIHADLVVLSACETALGQKVRGEGVIGLTWALFAGGARSCIATQWQVADDSTRVLMVEFYRRLRASPAEDESEALRRAQLALIHSKRYSHPYYWASFALSGCWR